MTKFVLQHKPLVALAWVLLAVVGFMTMKATPHRLDYSYTTPGQPGYIANEHIVDRFGLDATFEATLPVLRLPDGKSMFGNDGQAIAEQTFAAANHAGHLGLADYANTHNPKFILDHGRATWALITIPNPDTSNGIGGRIDPALQAATPSGGSVILTGFEKLLSNGGSNGQNRLTTTLLGAFGAFLVLLLVYGSPIAVVPVVMAAFAIVVTYLCVLGLTYVAPVSYFINYLVTTLSLGVAIDLSLVVVIRWREERERGLNNEEAIIVAGGTAGRAVMLSGLTAAIGLLSLTILPVPFLRSIGVGAMLIPFVAVAIAVTLLPVTLAYFGPALDRFSLWPNAKTTFSRSWERWAQFVVRHKWFAAFLGVAIMIGLALPGLSLNTAEPLIGSLSPSGKPAAVAFEGLKRNSIPSAVDFPIDVITYGGKRGLQEAITIALATPGVWTAISPDTPSYRTGGTSLLTIIPTAEGSTAAGKAIVTDLRSRLSGVFGGAEVGGSTAGDMAFTDAVYGNFPLLLTVVSLVTFLVLARSLRSIVLAAKAVVLNVVSLGAAFGFMVYFWQNGHGSSIFYGLPATGAIRAWIPTVVFASLFGLSMDYEVFVLARIVKSTTARARPTRPSSRASRERGGSSPAPRSF